MLKVLDLFSGIGGFSLGLERTGGFETVAFCEIEEFPRRVLAKHWPGVPIYDDVRTLTAERLRADGIAVDVICGGFPCQDISTAGFGAGIEGERSGLWSEIARLVRELRPAHVIVENVSALLGRGLDKVLGDLASSGYDAEWDCIPASAVGAPHQRDRIWIVAHARGQQHEGHCASFRRALAAELSHADPMADPAVLLGARRDDHGRSGSQGAGSISQSRDHRRDGGDECGWWLSEPAVGRVAHGVPARVDRLKSLGNAVVPQIPEILGRAILEARAAA